MQCPTCKRKMVSLFVTEACDYCDFGVPEGLLYAGFIVYKGGAHGPIEEYVFRTKGDAERWRAAANREGQPIYRVYSLMQYQWELSRGTLRDVTLADHIFEVFPDWRYELLPNRCFLGEEQPETPMVDTSDMDELPF